MLISPGPERVPTQFVNTICGRKEEQGDRLVKELEPNAISLLSYKTISLPKMKQQKIFPSNPEYQQSEILLMDYCAFSSSSPLRKIRGESNNELALGLGPTSLKHAQYVYLWKYISI